MEIDINRSCRSCLCNSNATTMHSISEPAESYENFGTIGNDTNMSIAEVIMTFTTVNITPDDGLPQSVCSKCLHQIQQVFQFKEKCEAVDLKLRSYSLNRTNPISCIKTEDDEMDQLLLETETVFVTKFEEDDDEPTVAANKSIVKREKPNREDAKTSASSKIKIEQSSIEIDEKTLIEQAEIVDGRYQCKFCEKTLVDRQTYKLHIRLHTGANLKRCAICDRGFAKKNHLERHLATHDKTHKCKSCTKAFLTRDERKGHELLCKKSTGSRSNKVEEENQTQHSQATRLTDCKEVLLNSTVPESEQDGPDNTNESDVKNMTLGENRLRTKIPLDADEQLLIKNAKLVNNRYECPLCTKTLSREEQLVLHIRTAHTLKNLLRCSVCDKGFAKPYNLNRHMLIHDNVNIDETITKATQSNGTYCCTFCAKVFLERQSFRVHLRIHTTANELNHSDEICYQKITKNSSTTKKYPPSKEETSAEADDEDEQLVNSAELLNGRYKCKFCEKTLANRSTLKLHIRLHLQKKLKICELCGHGYAKKSHLDRHMKTHFPIKPECKLCHATFESLQEKKVHMTDEHEAESKVLETNVILRPYKCDLCSKSFTTERRLSDHRLCHVKEEKRFACDICCKKFRRYDNMRTHMRSHIPPNERVAVAKTHLCSYCGRGFSNSSNLNSHIRTHTGEKAFKCDFCDSRFRRSCDLTCHRRTHTGEKPYPCLICGRRFSSSNKLIRHMRIHTGQRPYKCTECDRSFTQSNDLTLHIRRHTGDRPFGCDCGEKFITNSLLKQHRRNNGH